MAQENKNDIEAKEAKHGEKMVEIRVRFWTDNIEGSGRIRPKHAWGSGVVGIEKNKSHAITPGPWRPFNSLMELGSVIERVLIEHQMVLHHSTKMKKYMAEQPSKTLGKGRTRKPVEAPPKSFKPQVW